MTSLRSFFGRAFRGLVDVQLARPFLIVLLAVITTVPAAIAARGLDLKTDFSELLPQTKPSVVELRRVSARLTSASTLTLVAEVTAPNREGLARFADALVPKLNALGGGWVGSVDDGTLARRTF